MNKIFGTAVMAASLSLSGMASAGEQFTQHRGIDARATKIKLGGIVNLNIKQGATPSLAIIGDKELVEKVSVSQSGDTLSIDTNSPNWTFELRAELTVPNLQELTSHGVGSTEVKGFSGNEIRIILDGAGAVKMDSNYKNVVARLGGVGSMTLNAGASEQVDLKLGGAGHMAVNGSSKLLRANLGGVGSLDAKKLHADAVELDMSGLGGATVYAKTSANLKLSGLGSATVYGKPATRNQQSRGMGSVSWE
jgi:hypothetical protein